MVAKGNCPILAAPADNLFNGDGKTAGRLLQEHFEAAQSPGTGVPTEFT